MAEGMNGIHKPKGKSNGMNGVHKPKRKTRNGMNGVHKPKKTKRSGGAKRRGRSSKRGR